MFKIKTLFSFFILFPLIVFGQFKKSDIGLSSDFVESILIDQRGIKWIGTDEGFKFNNSFKYLPILLQYFK